LQIKQRGNDPKHFEIMPKEPMEPEKFKEDLAKIKTKPPEGINNKPHDAS